MCSENSLGHSLYHCGVLVGEDSIVKRPSSLLAERVRSLCGNQLFCWGESVSHQITLSRLVSLCALLHDLSWHLGHFHSSHSEKNIVSPIWRKRGAQQSWYSNFFSSDPKHAHAMSSSLSIYCWSVRLFLSSSTVSGSMHVESLVVEQC